MRNVLLRFRREWSCAHCNAMYMILTMCWLLRLSFLQARVLLYSTMFIFSPHMWVWSFKTCCVIARQSFADALMYRQSKISISFHQVSKGDTTAEQLLNMTLTNFQWLNSKWLGSGMTLALLRQRGHREYKWHRNALWKNPWKPVSWGSGVMSGTGSDLKVFSKIKLERAK